MPQFDLKNWSNLVDKIHYILLCMSRHVISELLKSITHPLHRKQQKHLKCTFPYFCSIIKKLYTKKRVLKNHIKIKYNSFWILKHHHTVCLKYISTLKSNYEIIKIIIINERIHIRTCLSIHNNTDKLLL